VRDVDNKLVELRETVTDELDNLTHLSYWSRAVILELQSANATASVAWKDIAEDAVQGFGEIWRADRDVCIWPSQSQDFWSEQAARSCEVEEGVDVREMYAGQGFVTYVIPIACFVVSEIDVVLIDFVRWFVAL
jgi:hypothetical protein